MHLIRELSFLILCVPVGDNGPGHEYRIWQLRCPFTNSECCRCEGKPFLAITKGIDIVSPAALVVAALFNS